MNKCKLNEFCQKHGFGLPVYTVDNPAGPPHNPTYENCTVTVGETTIKIQRKTGSKKEMENLAAEAALEKMEGLTISDTKKSAGPTGPCCTRPGRNEFGGCCTYPRPSGLGPYDSYPGPTGPCCSCPGLTGRCFFYGPSAAEAALEKTEGLTLSDTKKSADAEEGRARIYLVDYDNVADTPLDTLDGEIHLFVSLSFNLKTKKMEQIREQGNVEIHQASAPLPELVDHMMTWYAARNYNKWMRVTVVSRDSGLNALVEILKLNGIECVFFNDFNV